MPTKEDCNISHDKQSSISPTTECADKIINLRMNCQMSKPLKLNRDCLLHDSKQNNSVTKSKIINCARQSKVSETTKHECSKVSDSSQKVSLCCFHLWNWRDDQLLIICYYSTAFLHDPGEVRLDSRELEDPGSNIIMLSWLFYLWSLMDNSSVVVASVGSKANKQQR